jgi:WD40 repeat protein
MRYCLNPHCPSPENAADARVCRSCGDDLLLISQYRAIRLLGQGGFGRTWLAEDLHRSPRSRCVIKQLFPTEGRNAHKVSELFEQEAKQLEQLGKHPQIPSLLSHFEQADRQYIVQELIDGDTLAEEARRDGAFSEAEIRDLLNDLLPVLQFIHQQQVIHRDIKPDNIIRRRSDRKLVLVDFGAAKSASHTILAKTGTMIGSAGYAAPEQLRGKPIFASDLYSLGVTCIHLLTLMDPFDLFHPIEGTLLWREHLANQSVSVELGHILDTLIQPSVKQRYPSAAEVLQAVRSSVPTYSPPPPSSPTMRRPVHLLSRKLIASDAICQTLQGHNGKVYDIAFSPDGSMLVSGSGDETVRLWNSNTGKLLHTQQGGWWTGHRGLVHAVAFDPQGHTFASASWDKTIKLWDAETGQRLHALSEYPHVSTTIAFSPDGSLIASGGSSRRIKIWETATGQRVRVLLGHSRLIHSIAFSPDGCTLASGSSDHTIRLWNVKTGTVLHILKGHTSSVVSVAFSPNGQILASGGWDQVIKLWDVQTGQPLHTLIEFADSPHLLCFSPDGKTLANTSTNHTVRLWSLETRRELYTLQGHSSWINSMKYSPNGQHLATASSDGTIKIWQCD